MATCAMPVNNLPLVSVRLYGKLAKKFGAEFKLAVRNVAEAVRLLDANFNGGFYRVLRLGSYYVMHGGEVWDEGQSLNENEMALKLQDRVIHIVPVIEGAGSQKGGIFQIIMGVVLIGAAFVLSGGLAAGGIVAGFTAMSGTVWATVAAVGGAMAVGGIVQLISPQTKIDNKDSGPERQSTMFGGPINASAQGSCVPVVYGRAICGTVTISGSIHVTSSLSSSIWGSKYTSLGAIIGSPELEDALKTSFGIGALGP